jgi:hypothetical protein
MKLKFKIREIHLIPVFASDKCRTISNKSHARVIKHRVYLKTYKINNGLSLEHNISLLSFSE